MSCIDAISGPVMINSGYCHAIATAAATQIEQPCSFHLQQEGQRNLPEMKMQKKSLIYMLSS